MSKRIRFRDVGKVNPKGWEQPRMSDYKMVCCDCGLVHGMKFRVVIDTKGKPHVQFKCRRHVGLTKKWRKQLRITVRTGSRPASKATQTQKEN